MSLDWNVIGDRLLEESRSSEWRYGQGLALQVIAQRLRQQPGLLIADDVGLGKTRIALAVVRAVIDAGGTAAVLAPPGLLFQWENEWRTYAPPQSPTPTQVRTYYQLLTSQQRIWPLLRPLHSDLPAQPWALISHRFGVPSLRKDSHPIRFGLPALALALWRDKKAVRGFRNSALWRFAKESVGVCLTERCETESCYYCDFMTAVAFCAQDENAQALASLDEEKCISAETAAGYLTTEWRTSFLTLIGSLIGPADLVIIDEAHKARDEGAGSSQLSQLAGSIVVSRGRRLALTATPVELDTAQWNEVLHRAGLARPPMSVIREFGEAIHKAQQHPDRSDIIQRLIVASSAFQEGLRPHVLRRRRIVQPEMKALVGGQPGAHPHRSSLVTRIPYASVAPSWRPVIIALEGLGKAAKGGGSTGARRTADLRYAAGHIGKEVLETEVDGEAKVPIDAAEDPTGKRRRVAFWESIARTRVCGDALQLGSHPRVATVAGRLDGLLQGENPEKILVFGTFTRPLHALVDSLNRRAVLRFLDRGIPCPVGNSSDEVPALWDEWHANGVQVLAGLPGALPYQDRLKSLPGGIESLAELLGDANRRYRQLRGALSRNLDAGTMKEIVGNDTFAIFDGAEVAKLMELLRTRIVNGLLAGGSIGMEEVALTPDQIKSRAAAFWDDDFVRPCRSRDDDSSHGLRDDAGPSGPDRAVGGPPLGPGGSDIDFLQLRHLISTEIDAGLGRFGHFARLLIGDTSIESRRSLQAQFNRIDTFPRVLVAQSQVGREGLNLHRACRHVVVFNPEWNPAVMEQQIGRVDRIESLWERRAEAWKASGCEGPMPKILVEQVMFEGTYDEYQWTVADVRQKNLRAHLHGELLDPEAMLRVPDDLKDGVRNGAPDFEPSPFPVTQ